MENKTHDIRVDESGAHCSCGRARVTPDRSDARDWANQHFKYNIYAVLTDVNLNP